MPLSVDELLKPRIKRINKWPGMPHNCPEILKISGDRFYFPFDLDMELGYPLSSLPEWSHLVKPLEWWKDRPLSDMPEYVKCIKTPNQVTMPGDVIKLDKWFDHTIAKTGSEMYVMSTNCYLPATEQQYLAYTNSKK